MEGHSFPQCAESRFVLNGIIGGTGFSSFGRIGGRPLVLRSEVARLIRRRMRRRDFATSQSSKGNTQRDARRAVSGAKQGAKWAMPSEGLGRRTGRERGYYTAKPASPRGGFSATENVSIRKMVEAVGIEPTSDGQSPQATTSVSCVLPSPHGRAQAGLPQG